MSRLITATLLSMSLLTLSCARDVGLVDRTQPGKLKKQALDGEWYYRQTVVDVPFTTGVTFIGEQSYLDRVRWEISEEFLTAYRTYERVEGSELPSQLPGTDYQGAPVAAFRISKHFDVFREYNPATGEQTNVLVENDYDRPWYEREYMRVDWSTNLLADFDFIAGGEQGLSVLAQAASYAVTDPKSPDAPVFGVKDGDSWEDHRDPAVWGELDRVDYFDLTLKLQVTPETFLIEYEDGWVEEWPACWFYEWGPWDCASQTIKVRGSFMRVPPSDYEPLYYPDNYIARDADGEAIRTMWDDAAGAERRCTSDEGEDCVPVRVPMFDRFGYFRIERETYDRDYEVTEEGRLYLITRFNIWQESVRDGEPIPYAERRVKPIVFYLPANFPEALQPAAAQIGDWWNEAFADTVRGLQGNQDDHQVFVVRPNSYRVEDGEIVDFGQRNGDLRYSHLYWVDNPQFESLLGYGPSAADPLTGEIIAADSYAYGAALDSYASYAADIVDLMRGRILESEFIEGEHVGAAIAGMGNRPGISREQMRGRVQRSYDKGLKERLSAVRHRGREAYRRGHDYTNARLAMADEDPFFEHLWTDEMSHAYEARVGRRLEPSEFGAGRLARALMRHKLKLGKKALDFRHFDDAAVLGIVQEMGDRPREEVVAFLREQLFKATATHEIGHSLGLRHNFAASTDALNYHDEYWQIRDPNAQALDLPTRNEMQLGLRQYAYSSIMDYGAKFLSDLKGLGKYDHAAIKFGYGQLVEAFVNPPYWEDHDLLWYYNIEDVHDFMHYTDYPDLFDSGSGNGLASMAERKDIPNSEVVAWLTLEPGAEDLMDNLVPYKFCSDEYVGAYWDCDVWDEGADPYEIVNYATQTFKDYYIFRAFKRHRRYLDPIDYYYGTYFNTMVPLAAQYQTWLFDQWYLSSDWYWLSLMDADYGTNVTENEDWNLDPHGGLARTAAAMTAMNFLSEVIATPEPGSYYTDPDTGVLTWWTSWEDNICGPGQDSAVDDCSDIYIPVGPGKYAYSEFASDTGYYWYERIHVVGSFWDKLAAVETLADPTTYFLGVDDVADYSTYVLGFNIAFPNAVGTLFGSLVNDDYRKYAAALETDGSFSVPWIFDTVDAAYGDQPAPDRVGPFIDPATNFTVGIYALWYGMALLNASFDQSFNDYAKIWLEGSGEAFTPQPGAVLASFTNPRNGRTYVAAQPPDPRAYGMGYEMISRAERIKNEVEANPACDWFDEDDECWGKKYELELLIENVELVRGYYDFYGYAWW